MRKSSEGGKGMNETGDKRSLVLQGCDDGRKGAETRELPRAGERQALKNEGSLVSWPE
jgi:hypothetical protein